MKITGKIAGAVTALILIAGCSTEPVDTSDVRVSPDDMKLGLILDVCGTDVKVQLIESPGQVVIDAHVSGGAQNADDCQTQYVAELKEPLGDRVVIDKASGTQLSVGPGGPAYDWTPGLHK